MYPTIFGVSAYFSMWAIATTVCLVIATFGAARDGYPASKSVSALLLVGVAVLVGAKLMYLAESWIYPHEDYVPTVLRGSMHGFRIPGGILAMAVFGPLISVWVGLPWREWGDVVILAAPVLLIFIRIGCFLNGCCFGETCALPWAVRFPAGSWAYWDHRVRSLVSVDATATAPVHPLQLYFILAAALTLVVLVGIRKTARPWTVQLVFYALFFGTTSVIEEFRAHPLTLNGQIAPLASLGFFALMLVRAGRDTSRN